MADTETKTPFEANGDTIAEIKALVDALPDAGSGRWGHESDCREQGGELY